MSRINKIALKIPMYAITAVLACHSLTSGSDAITSSTSSAELNKRRPTSQPATRAVVRPLVGSAMAGIDMGLAIGDEGNSSLFGLELAALDETRRFEPTVRPDTPSPQRPPLSTPENVDTGRPPFEWQRATDDWGGLRPSLEDEGIAFQATLAIEYSRNARGGINSGGGGFRNLFDANFTLDTKRLVGLEGGTVFVNFQNQDGSSANDAGDAQGYSNIDADGRTQVSEAWYEHTFRGEMVRIKLGKIDANSEFAYAENAGEFLNSSMGFSPTVVGLPTYPDSAFGLNMYVQPADTIYLALGVFDGAGQEGIPTGSHGPKTLFGSPSDLFLIGELGLKWDAGQRRDGRIGFGGWRHTGTFYRFDGESESGTSGFYLVVDQMLWRLHADSDTDDRGISAYFQYGYADPRVSELHQHVGSGVVWTGMLPGRNDDVAGLGWSYVRLSDAMEGTGDELAVELFYKLQLTPWISLKGDLQYIRHPGGEPHLDDALITTLRAVIDF